MTTIEFTDKELDTLLGVFYEMVTGERSQSVNVRNAMAELLDDGGAAEQFIRDQFSALVSDASAEEISEIEEALGDTINNIIDDAVSHILDQKALVQKILDA